MHNIHLFFEHFRIQAGRRGRRSCAGMVGRCGSGRKSHKSLQFLEGQLQRPQSRTALFGTDHTTRDNEHQPMEVHVHQSALSSLCMSTQSSPDFSFGGCYTGGGTSRFLKNTRMLQEHIQHTHGCTGLAVTGTSGVFNRLPGLFLELLSHHNWGTQQAA